MPGVLTHVIKGKMNARVESRLTKQAGESLDSYIDRLEQLKAAFEDPNIAHVEIAKTQYGANDTKVARNAADEAHAKDEFFGDAGNKQFFPGSSGDEEDHVVRGTMIRALDVAIDSARNGKPLPVVIYWIVTGRSDTDPAAIEGYVAKCEDRQIDVMILTPFPQYEPPTRAGEDVLETMWVVGTPRHVSELKDRLKNAAGGSGYPINDVSLGSFTGAECIQVVGY